MMDRKKVGRNDPCFCGSGKKYKKCHLGLGRDLKEALVKIEDNKRQSELYEQKFGKARPIMGVEFNGSRIVVEGSGIHILKDSVKTPVDFLWNYLRQLLGKSWWETQCNLPLSQRHEAVDWAYRMHNRLSAGDFSTEDGIAKGEYTWPTWQFLMLARDLHVTRDHLSYQGKITKRLRITNQFRGARNELFAAATMIRAGFKIEWEDDKGRSGKPVEFIARNDVLSEVIAVEAKSGNVARDIPRVKSLLIDAFAKDTECPLVVFLDLFITPFGGHMSNQAWFQEFKNIIETTSLTEKGEQKFTLLIVTNLWSDPRDDSKTDFYQDFMHIVPVNPRVPFSSPDSISTIVKSLCQFGTIPNEFV